MKLELWREGNRVKLLENGEEYFPRVFAAVGQARHEVLIETFILAEDKVGRQLQMALIAAAHRGVHVELTVDGYGSAGLSPEFAAPMLGAGVRLHVFDPKPKLLGMRTNIFRRLHRKLIVIDGRKAFVGGINFSLEHLREYGAGAKQDYAVEIDGPVVSDIHTLLVEASAEYGLAPTRVSPRPRLLAAAGHARALLVTRDNDWHSGDIERLYREAISDARCEIVIANAYFLPGYRLLRDLRNAARRGVAVHLLLQGKPDKPEVRWAAANLYDYLLDGGVRIYEYGERPMHGKVAVIDGNWTTVGSSNLDPLSLFLNLEANLVVRDVAFAEHLRARLMELIERRSHRIGSAQLPKRTLWRQGLSVAVFHVLRRFPAWAGWLPAHTPRRSALPALRAAKRGRNAA